jgi:OPT family small oligopeptide transporter
MVLGLKRTPFNRQNTDSNTATVPQSSSNEIIDKNDDSKAVYTTGAEGVAELDIDEGLIHFEQNHRWDPNLPSDYADKVHNALKAHDIDAELAIERGLAEQSPYPEVQAAVRNYDEDVPANTLRAWVIGLLLTTIGSGLNMLFSLRNPQIVITSIVAQLIAYPIGNAWYKVMPKRTFTTFGFQWSLNPGPFNMKEHTVIVVMANCSFGGGAAYSTDILVAQQAFYGQNFGWWFKLLLTWTTQMCGYGLAGLARRFLVWPAAMIWPTNLVNTSLFYALHDHSPADPSRTGGWQIGRYRWFLYVASASFVWYWFPGFIFQALSAFAFVTWIRPNSVIINQLFGAYTGLSLLPITFDWTTVTGYLLSPLIPPWHAIANSMIGTVFFFWIVTLGVHYSGGWYAEYLPISDNTVYDNTGTKYNVSSILTPEFTLDEVKYKAYSVSHPFLPGLLFCTNQPGSRCSCQLRLLFRTVFRSLP